MNIDEMPAGRELDALVAEKVMGYVFKNGLTKYGNRGNGWGVKEIDFVNQEFLDNFKPSTDISAAWEVVEKMRKDRYRFSAADHGGGLKPWSVRMEHRDDNSLDASVGFADTAPLAICRAALKAKEGG